ncbi:MAG: hypothetical protein ABUS47_04885 [Steroidobacter sp.]
MWWFDDVDLESPPVFWPKVTPDPLCAERLEEKFRQARRQPGFKPHYPAPPALVPSLIASSARRMS